MLRANLIILGLFALTAAIGCLTYLAVRALGLLPDERRHVMAAVGIVTVVLNYFISRRLHR
jgi:hypothetical protein